MREAEYVMQQPAKSDRVLALARKFPIVRTRAMLKASGRKLYRYGRQQRRARPAIGRRSAGFGKQNNEKADQRPDPRRPHP